eukprot:12061848-Karenia_brevis.AAC.1
MASVSSELHYLAKLVLNNESLSVKARCVYAQAYAFNKGYYNSETWPNLTLSEHKSLHSGTMRVYKRVFKNYLVQPRKDSDILHTNGLLSPLGMLMLHRMSLFVRLVTKPHSATLVALYCAKGHKRSWIRAVWHDVKFLAAMHPDFAPCMSWSMSRWVQHICIDPK